jgi:hypothetical protein
MVGMYGDADPLDKNQWLELSISSPTDARQWSDKTSTCKNVFSGMLPSLHMKAFRKSNDFRE